VFDCRTGRSAFFLPRNLSLTPRQAPYALRDARFGTRLGQDLVLEDTLWQGLADSHCNLPMGMTAENLADKYKVTRQEAEQYAAESQRRVAHGACV
jgi:acetyl-CoA acyltransferase 2